MGRKTRHCKKCGRPTKGHVGRAGKDCNMGARVPPQGPGQPNHPPPVNPPNPGAGGRNVPQNPGGGEDRGRRMVSLWVLNLMVTVTEKVREGD